MLVICFIFRDWANSHPTSAAEELLQEYCWAQGDKQECDDVDISSQLLQGTDHLLTATLLKISLSVGGWTGPGCSGKAMMLVQYYNKTTCHEYMENSLGW